MADNVVITPGSGKTVLADEVVDGTLGTGVAQFVKIMDGTLDGTTKCTVGANGIYADVRALPALPAGTNVVGVAISPQQTGALYSSTTALTPKFAAIVASASGPTTIVAAVSGKKIRVLRYSLNANGAVNVKFQSHVTPTDLTGLHYGPGVGPIAGGAYCPLGLFETVSGEALDINLSGAVAVGGELTYVEV